MFSVDFICQHPQLVREGLQRRRDSRGIDDILLLVEQRRGLSTRCDGLYATLKKLKDTVRTVPTKERAGLNAQLKAIAQDIKPLELQMDAIDTRLQPLLLSLPNLPHQSVPDGDGPQDDQEVRRWGEPLSFLYTPREHEELATHLDILETESAAKIAGSRFVTLKGAGARLERALLSFMLDLHTRKHGYTEVLPPQLVKRSVMQGAGQLPKFENQAYSCTEEDLYLNPTAEVPLVGMHSESIFPPETLPLRYVAWTTAYRREAGGSTSRQTRGLLRLHQFNKVELFQFTPPQTSYEVLEQMLLHAEMVLRNLELHYRVVELCTGSLPFTASKTYDLQVWMPGLQEFVEVSSISNCEAFQAQRAAIRYRATNSAHTAFVHTLNASGLAVGRTMAAVLETYQQADGSIIVPKVLRPYMSMAVIEKL